MKQTFYTSEGDPVGEYEMKKTCASCKVSRLIELFPLKVKGGDKRYEYCKECARKKNKVSYGKHKEKHKKRVYEYQKANGWHYRKKWAAEHVAERKYASLKHRCKGKVEVMPREVFLAWFKSQKLECTYCGIQLTKMSQIDRMNPKLGYIEGNITLACLRCNMIKNNFFTPEQMKEIAEKYIKPTLHNEY